MNHPTASSPTAAPGAADPRRRRWLGHGLGLALALTLKPAEATPESMAEAIRVFTAGASPRPGRVTLDIAPLVDNGNTVPVGIVVDSPMTAADHVSAIALFNERNPLPEIVQFHLGPRAGRARVETRIRLATSQRIVAVARMNDGRCWSASAEVVVTLAACIE